MPDSKTVFVTGASGYIAKHIVLQLLQAGHRVVGSVRRLDRASEVAEALRPQLQDPAMLDQQLSFAALDLTEDAGWAEAMGGADVLMHTASPFPLTQPRDENEVIRPAVEGALRALRAAAQAGVGRVVLTSSCVAIMHKDLPPGRDTYTEDDWTDLNHREASPYAKSKTLAERAAWDFVAHEAPEMKLSAINPGLVLGPPLDLKFGTSVRVLERILRGRDPMLPRIGFPVVDVRDVARMHVLAMDRDEAAGHRFIAADRFMWYQEIAEILARAYPDRRIPTRLAPDFLIRLMGLFDRSVRSVTPTLGRRMDVSNARAREMLGMEFTPAETSILETAEFLIRHELV